MISLDELQGRIQAHFGSHFMYLQQDMDLQIVQPGSGVVEDKKMRIVIAANLTEGYHHYAVGVPHAGIELTELAPLVRDACKKMLREVIIKWASPNDDDQGSLQSTAFTKQVYIFTDVLSIAKSDVVKKFVVRNMTVKFVDDARWHGLFEERPADVFICHDSRDKEVYAKPLYSELVRRWLKPWYDEVSIEYGQSLAAAVDDGLTRTRYGVILISPNFLQNNGWASREFSALITRQFSEKRGRLILPVWCGVDRDQVAARSSFLADIKALNWAQGISVIADQLVAAIGKKEPPSGVTKLLESVKK